MINDTCTDARALEINELDLISGGDTEINFGNGITLGIYTSPTGRTSTSLCTPTQCWLFMQPH